MMKAKKLAALALAVWMVLCLAACGGSASDKYEYQGVLLSLPEGFTVDDSSSNLVACPPEYPEKTDNIVFAYSGADAADSYTQEILDAYYSTLMDDFQSKSFQKTTIGGKDVIKYSYDMSMNGVAMEQTQVMVFFSDKTVIISFTSVSGDYDSAFSDAINSIEVK